MDLLIRKSDKAVENSWPNGTVGRIPHPDKPLGALTMGAGEARPLDLGDFILVAATEVKPTPGENEMLAGPTFEIGDGPDFAATATWTVEAIPVTVPVSVSPRQARIALNAAGLRQAVEDWVASQDQDIKDSWEFALDIRRDDPLILAAAAALSLTEQQLDALFIAAGSITTTP